MGDLLSKLQSFLGAMLVIIYEQVAVRDNHRHVVCDEKFSIVPQLVTTFDSGLHQDTLLRSCDVGRDASHTIDKQGAVIPLRGLADVDSEVVRPHSKLRCALQGRLQHLDASAGLNFGPAHCDHLQFLRTCLISGGLMPFRRIVEQDAWRMVELWL
ncbi:hypothetical protein EJ03DRAFT_208623 [Teratosphaeria nubilosa]|uniref:Uncharacterized protein n=1 Tax=Teratosphaeria nubilosa TaxID=161662 RepID=A0A6G1KXU4_9PEZI|nr:hypothetical protein EJ03DRAFT_208623 [Teratosphaeria nubilosa]